MSANINVNTNNANQNLYNNNNNNQVFYNNNNGCCSCSENTKLSFKIMCCPCYMLYSTFTCFCDDRFSIEPYYTSFLFVDNIIVFILSLIDLILVIIFREDLSTAFIIIRIISDSFGFLVLWLAFACWSEEATDEDHMDPAFLCFTSLQTILMVSLDTASLIIFSLSDFKLNLIGLISIIIHIATPILFPAVYCCFNNYNCCRQS